MVDELSGMTVFAAVAETKGFRSAGERLGVSASAVSQELRKLEERLGVALVQRTTRSVRLTEAGERLYATARPALEEVRSAVTALGEMSDELRGSLRLYVAPVAHAFLAGPFLAGFLGDHPRATLDVDNLRRTRRDWRLARYPQRAPPPSSSRPHLTRMEGLVFAWVGPHRTSKATGGRKIPRRANR